MLHLSPFETDSISGLIEIVDLLCIIYELVIKSLLTYLNRKTDRGFVGGEEYICKLGNSGT